MYYLVFYIIHVGIEMNRPALRHFDSITYQINYIDMHRERRQL